MPAPTNRTANEILPKNLRLRSILERESFDDRAPVRSFLSLSSTGAKSKLGSDDEGPVDTGFGARGGGGGGSDAELDAGLASLAEGPFGLGGTFEANVLVERKASPRRAVERASMAGFMARHERERQVRKSAGQIIIEGCDYKG